MRDYAEQVKRLRNQAKLERYYNGSGEICDNAADAIEELLRIGAKMHTWIFLHTTDEQAAYDEIGLTDEQNALFGYSGQMILKAEPPKNGKWIAERDGSIVELSKDGFVGDSCHCSVCNEHLDGSEEYAVKGIFCPSCGAIMNR